MLPCIIIDFFLNYQLDAIIIQIYSVIKFYMFQALCPSSGVFYCTIGTGKFHAGFLMTASRESQDVMTLPGSGHQNPHET
jgi:hypothetical protein